MKRLFYIGIFLCIRFLAHGTAQAPDIIIYKGDTLKLHNCPLEALGKPINPQRLFNSEGCFSTGCWRGYIATWEIIDNKLYLIKIRNTCYPTHLEGVAASYKHTSENVGKEYADLNELFPDRYVNGKVFADWVTDYLYLPFGQMLRYVHMGFESTYEYEYRISVKKGIIDKEEKLDNTKTKETIFSKPPENKHDTLIRYIQSQINWTNLPHLPIDSILVVPVSFSANENGIIDEVNISKKDVPKAFKNEAMRIVKTIPWRVVYQHEKPVKETYSIAIRFAYPLKEEEIRQLNIQDSLIINYSTEQKAKIVRQRENISDSIEVLFYKEQRIQNTGKYEFRYIFIDYNNDNQYINRWKEKDKTDIPSIIENRTEFSIHEKYHTIKEVSRLISPWWRPLLIYKDSIYNHQDRGCFITDSVFYDKYNTVLFEKLVILNDDHFRLIYPWGKEERSIDFLFVDKTHSLVVIKFSSQKYPILYVDSRYATQYPSMVFHNRWGDSDISHVASDIEYSAKNNLPGNAELFRNKIREILKRNQ